MISLRIKQVQWSDLHYNTINRLADLTNESDFSTMAKQLVVQNPSVKVFIARNSKKHIVGWCTAQHIQDDPRIYDIDVYVDPRYRRQRVATRLVLVATDTLKKLKRRYEIPEVLKETIDELRRRCP